MSAVTGVAVPAEKVPAPGMRTLFEPAGNSLALFNVAGQIYAIDDSCPHQGSSLCGGRLEGRVIQCCAHGLRFDLASSIPPVSKSPATRSRWSTARCLLSSLQRKLPYECYRPGRGSQPCA